jgi:hypothetical protein
MSDDVQNENLDQLSRDGALTETAYSLTSEQFAALKVADRDTAIFLLVREMAASIKSLEMRIDEYEAKAKELATPEGIAQITDKFLGGMGGGMGGMLGGMFK